MSQRHYLRVINENNRILLDEQILGNNEFFDDTFYDNLGIVVDDESFDSVEIEFTNFLNEWYAFLNRYPEMQGIPKISKLAEEKYDKDSLEWKELLYLHYLTSISYEMQIFDVTKKISKYLNYKGQLEDDLKLILICY